MQLPWKQPSGGDGARTPRHRAVERDDSTPNNLNIEKVEDTQGSQWCSTKWPSPTTLAVVLALMSLLVTAHSWGGQGYITNGMVWMREHEQQGRVWFVVAYTMCLLLLLPASVLALLAGACFGLLWGVALVYCANIIGQTLAFLLARSFLHDRLYAIVTSHWPQFTSIDAALRREGWRLVFVLRLSPCVPFVLLNYALGLTSISFLEYSLASAVAIIPFVVISVYLGLASGTALQMLDNAHWPDRSDRSLINPQETHSGPKGTAQEQGARISPPRPNAHVNAALSTAAATAETTGMYSSGDSSMQAPSTTLVTVATCILAVVTAVYAVWFIKRVTSEVLEEEPCERIGSAGGLMGFSIFADSSGDVDQCAAHRSGHGDTGAHTRSSSVPCLPSRAEEKEVGSGATGWPSQSCVVHGPFQGVLPSDTEGEQIAPARLDLNGLARYSREPSVSSPHSTVQQRWPGSFSRSMTHAATAAVHASMLPMVRSGPGQSAESSHELVRLEKR